MSGEEIKKECDLLYAQIKEGKERLTELRSICKHEETFKGLYEYRVAARFPALICSYCGEVVRNLLPSFNEIFANPNT